MTSGGALTPGQREWIAQLLAQPLRLYRVTDVQPGTGMTLVDEFDPQADPQPVREVSGSRTATPCMLMGARIMEVAAGAGIDVHLELSGAIYPFSKLAEATVLARARQVLASSAGLNLHSDNQRDAFELAIARAWLDQWFAPAPLPLIQDASTGDPLLLVTDHYRVLDAPALAASMASQPDVHGDAQQGWDRMIESADGGQRSLSTINPGRSTDRVELFYRTQRLADDGRAWFEGVAGAAVQHLTREITDPAGHLARAVGVDTGRTPRSASAETPHLPPEVIAQAIEQALHRHHANWVDETIPALGGRTPRQAITTPAGLERVKGLLREYEAGERRQSAAQGRPAVSYQFLWDALGIPR